MDSSSSLTSPGGIQDWFTDPDSWIFSYNTNRSQAKRDENALESCKNCSQEQKMTKISSTPQTSSETAIKLHEIIVNGLFIAQKRDPLRKEDSLSFFKGNENFAHYDYVLTTMMENGSKSIQKYIRSKI